MKLDLYTAVKYGLPVSNYQLKDTMHTGSPQSVIDICRRDIERYPVVILNENNQLVGFFCLHLGKGPEQYDFDGAKSILMRAFSIDERFRNQGYASSALLSLTEFIYQSISAEIERVILAVNAKNISAQKAYKKAGFVMLSPTFEGKLGKLQIMEKVLE